METFNSMPSVLTQYVYGIERTYEPLSWLPNAIAWAQGGYIKYYMNSMENPATIYHEVAHAWDWETSLSYTKVMYDIFHEEWVGTGVYGATNVQEAVAETVAHIYTGHPIPHAPKTVAITRQWLGLDPLSPEYAHYAELTKGNDTLWNAENNNSYDRVMERDILVYSDYQGTEYGVVKAGTRYRKLYETISHNGVYRHVLQIDNGATVIAIF